MAELAIEARGLSVQRGARMVLEGVSFDASYGEVLAVLGPNGAGKSTLLRALCGLTDAQGELRLAGHALRTLDAARRARLVSFVPQQSQLVAALPVHEVVGQGRYAHRAQSAAAHARAISMALADTDSAPLANRPFNELSCGEQKRVLLARALCSGARLLLLDEPTASLDIEHALRLLALLRSLALGGHCIVVVLHQLEEALQLADRALLLKDGRALAQGPSREVIDEPHVRTLYGVELLRGAGLGFRLPDAP